MGHELDCNALGCHPMGHELIEHALGTITGSSVYLVSSHPSAALVLLL